LNKNGCLRNSFVGSTLKRRVGYSLFDKPLTIWSSQGESRFEYDASEERAKRIDIKSGGNTTTYYLGNNEVIIQPNGTTETKRYIQGIAIRTNQGTSQAVINYVFDDHLGSGSIFTNETGNVLETASYDAFGKRRNAKNWQSLTNPFSELSNLSSLLSITQNGFTGHVQVDHASIIHMGGRIYDPELGRFAQADPVVENPKDAQTLNRYSYVLNNPLSYTDPSGYMCSASDMQNDSRCNGSIEKTEGITSAISSEIQNNGSNETQNHDISNSSAANSAGVAKGDEGGTSGLQTSFAINSWVTLLAFSKMRIMQVPMVTFWVKFKDLMESMLIQNIGSKRLLK
jgi:RHS repeat-associated protein